MCTVTFIARRQGYALGMNRDEKLARVAALPPSRHRAGQHDALLPSEPNGGTWMGVNDAGVTLALINWYSVPARAAGHVISRGQIVRSALAFDSPGLVDAALTESPLAFVKPFRLIGVFLKSAAVAEWCWNLKRLERRDHPWQANTWISSGFDESGAQQTRGETFANALRQKSAGRADWLHRLHRSHAPECGPYSHCMHREDAATVSYTQVTVSRHSATMRYAPGAPCCTPPIADLRLQLSVAGRS